MSVLVALTLGAVSATALYICAYFGSEIAANLFFQLSLPKYNLFANFLPASLHDSIAGTELILATIILQATLVLAIGVFGILSLARTK
jgi:hypothetical protein